MLFYFLLNLSFQWKQFAVLLLYQHQVLVIYLNQLLSSYSIFWRKDNLANIRLCNRLLEQPFFWMFFVLISSCTGWLKKFLLSIMTCNLLFLHLKENIFCVLFTVYAFQRIKQKAYLVPENFEQLSNVNLGFARAFYFLSNFIRANFAFELLFQLLW